MSKGPNQQRQAAVVGIVAAIDSKFFKALSDPARIEILRCLLLHGPSDVGGIAKHCPQDRSVISRHLQLMHAAGLLARSKEGRHVHYAIDGHAFLGRMQGLMDKIKQGFAKGCC